MTEQPPDLPAINHGPAAQVREPDARRLRAVTFLAPGIPYEFFSALTQHLSQAIGCKIDLVSEKRSSGPMHCDADPFAEGRADIGFLCSPSYLYLKERPKPSIKLIPSGFVFRDPRHEGQPVYFSDVVVRSDHLARQFQDLEAKVWGYNDKSSLSGYFSTLQTLHSLGRSDSFFDRWVHTGSHHASIQATLDESIDGAAIDSVVLGMLQRKHPELKHRLRILTSWGPFPIQPVIVRTGIDPGCYSRLTDALLSFDGLASTAQRQLSSFGLERCVPIDENTYAEERNALRALTKSHTLPHFQDANLPDKR